MNKPHYDPSCPCSDCGDFLRLESRVGEKFVRASKAKKKPLTARKIKLALTIAQVDLLRVALNEYAEVCARDSEVPDGMEDGYPKAKYDKKSQSYKCMKQLEKLLKSIYTQVKEE